MKTGVAVLPWLICLSLVAAQDAPTVQVTVDPLEGHVGDPLSVTIAVELSTDTELEAARIGPELGPFSVVSGNWDGPSGEGATRRWTWSGTIAAFETGSLEIPSIRLKVSGAGNDLELTSEPLAVEIRSVLSEEDLAAAEPELADLKPPATMPGEYGPLWAGLGVLGLLLIVAGGLWWLQRRYAGRLAAVPAAEDPFRRMPPHVWVYAELQALLERRLPEQGEIELFFAEIARILKRYLGGRYRVDLLEHTTEEVPELLRQAGAPDEPIDWTYQALGLCDRVKFAKYRPEASSCRSAVDEVYRIVDNTKPVAEAPAPAEGERGAA